MSAPLPSALRTRFRKLIEEGLSGRAEALRVKLSASTGTRWARSVRTRGHADPGPQGRPKGSGKLVPYSGLFEELVTQYPDITLHELRAAPAEVEGVTVHHSSISDLMSKRGRR
jgi:transposase